MVLENLVVDYLKIERAENGFLLSFPHPENPGQIVYRVVEDIEDFKEEATLSEMKTAKKLLWEVIEFFGLYGSKHSHKIKIEIINKDGEVTEEL